MTRFLIAVLFLLLSAVSVMAQGPAPPPPLNQVPLDGLSMLLLAGGAAYGGKKLMRRKR